MEDVITMSDTCLLVAGIQGNRQILNIEASVDLLDYVLREWKGSTPAAEKMRQVSPSNMQPCIVFCRITKSDKLTLSLSVTTTCISEAESSSELI